MVKASSTVLISRIRKCLEKLSCPYLEDGSDQWLAELLLHPSEARIKLLSWIVSEFDPKFNEILDESVPVISNRIDSRYQKLLLSLNIMGICKIDDLELVRGTATQKKQLRFWDNLVDMLYTSQLGYAYMNEPLTQDTSYFLKPARVPTLDELYQSSCNFVDTLVREHTMQDLFSTEIHLFSPDLESQIEKEISNQTIPSVDMLVETVEKMQSDLQIAEQELHKSKKKYNLVEPKQSTVEIYCRKIDLSMKTFSQMIDSFLHIHESDIETWCHKQKPDLSEVGPTVKSVNNILQNHHKLITSLTSLNSTARFLSNDLKGNLSGNEHDLQKNKELSRLRNTLQRSITRRKAI